MKSFATKLVGLAVMASSLVVAVAPAEARHRHYRHRDRVDAGDVIAGIFLIGAIAAIADSAGKNKGRDRQDGDYRYDRRDRDYRAAPEPQSNRQWTPGSNSDESRAVEACSWAAEGEIGDFARVGQIDGVEREGNDWRVTGSVAAPETMPRDFTCTYRAGRVTSVDFN
ncbi:MAG: hypothetical protein HC788_15400 [Sphingopyxis sp.]|nr:hypothetical protein [Sphingopyxis sp.]